MDKDRRSGHVQTGSFNLIFSISRLESDCFYQVWMARNTQKSYHTVGGLKSDSNQILNDLTEPLKSDQNCPLRHSQKYNTEHMMVTSHLTVTAP